MDKKNYSSKQPVCPKCGNKLGLNTVIGGYDTFKCTFCGEVLAIKNAMLKGEPKEIDGRHVI